MEKPRPLRIPVKFLQYSGVGSLFVADTAGPWLINGTWTILAFGHAVEDGDERPLDRELHWSSYVRYLGRYRSALRTLCAYLTYLL